MEVRKYQKKMCHANVCHWYNVRFCYQSKYKADNDESDNESEMSSKKSVNG